MSTSSVVFAAVLAVMAAVAFAVAAAGQQHHASAVPGERTSARVSTGLVRELVRRAAWRNAMIMTFVGSGLHIVALGLAPITLIQPIGVLALPAALPMQAHLAGTSVGLRRRLAAALVVVGLLAVLIPAARTAPAAVVGTVAIVAVGGVVASVAAATALLAPRCGALGPVLLAAGAAVCFGGTSGLVRALIEAAAALSAWALVLGVVLAAFALTGIVLLQSAYRHGGLGAPLATLTLLDPLAAGVMGVVVLREPVAVSAPAWAVGLCGLLCVALGVIGLTRTEPVRDASPSLPPGTGGP